jgi:mRNA interferase MazF
VSFDFGDIVTVAGGVYASKPRPAVVFQRPAPTGDSTIVLPLTSTDNPNIPFRVAIRPTAANGLDRPCHAEVDKISAIRSEALGRRIGHLEAEPLAEATRLAHTLMSPAPAQ